MQAVLLVMYWMDVGHFRYCYTNVSVLGSLVLCAACSLDVSVVSRNELQSHTINSIPEVSFPLL